MKHLLFITLFLGGTNLLGQQQDSLLTKEVTYLKEELVKQQKKAKALSDKIENQNYKLNKLEKNLSRLESNEASLDSALKNLATSVDSNNSRIDRNTNELGVKIQENRKETNVIVSELDGNLRKNRFYWIIATLATLLLGGLIYWLLGKRITSSKTDVETQIRNTKASLEEESVKLDNKLIEVLETQLKLQQETAKLQPVTSNEKADHSLALKVADEIVRMQKNISKMGSDTKGLKPLLKGIERIQNNFAANGYEMINHLNKAYDERFNIDVINFITDDDLDEGTRIITAVIKPQVNYKGVLIQRAQVDVSQN